MTQVRGGGGYPFCPYKPQEPAQSNRWGWLGLGVLMGVGCCFAMNRYLWRNRTTEENSSFGSSVAFRSEIGSDERGVGVDTWRAKSLGREEESPGIKERLRSPTPSPSPVLGVVVRASAPPASPIISEEDE